MTSMNMELEKLRFNFHRLLGASSPPLLRNCQGSVFPCFCNYKLRFMFPMDCLGDIWEEPVFNNTEDPWRSNQENSCPWSRSCPRPQLENHGWFCGLLSLLLGQGAVDFSDWDDEVSLSLNLNWFLFITAPHILSLSSMNKEHF